MPSVRKIIYTTITAIFAIVLLEAVLFVAAVTLYGVEQLLARPGISGSITNSTLDAQPILTRPAPSRSVADSILGARPNPEYPGHDSNGFRNTTVPRRSDVVALGDSQTYGVGVAADAAWPHQFELLTGYSTYSMAFGGYGPVHSLLLWDEAIALKPQIIIEALYAGNDLFDSFNIVYNNGQHSELRSPDLGTQKSIVAAESNESIADHVTQMFTQGHANTVGSKVKSGTPHPIRSFLSEYSRIYGLLRRLQFESLQLKPAATRNSSYTQSFEDGPFRTVFTSEYRLSALDQQDPRIVEGREISLKAIAIMNELAAEQTIRFVVVLIPTKELVFKNLWSEPSASFATLTSNEILFWSRTKAFLKANNIDFIDVLPALRGQLESGIQPYHSTQDGHPNKFGHQAIAASLSDRLTRTTTP